MRSNAEGETCFCNLVKDCRRKHLSPCMNFHWPSVEFIAFGGRAKSCSGRKLISGVALMVRIP
jgi:hypothetical protein